MRGSSQRRQLCLAGLAVTAACVACRTERLVQPPAGGNGGDETTTTHTISTSSSIITTPSTTSTSTGPLQCPAEPIPSYVPAGWVEMSEYYSCDCRFYVPGSKEVLPPPIEWLPCPEAPEGIVCQQMDTSWSDSPAPIGSGAMMDRASGDDAVLAFGRDIGAGYALIARADGPVHTAWMARKGASCLGGSIDLVEGRFILGLSGPSTWEGAMGGSIDALEPEVLLREDETDNPFNDGWACSGKWVARLKWPFVMTVHPWDMSKEIFVTSQATDPDGLDMSQPVMLGDAFFWTTANVSLSGINVWDPVGGTRAFMRWLGDATRGAGNLGTDGVDLVWSYGEGGQSKDHVFAVRSVMTTPFTTDPEKAAKTQRRLRSDLGAHVQIDAWVVGCGYAARNVVNKVFLVRLSDGSSWLVPNSPTQELRRPIGITCEHLYALGDIGPKYTLARVRLDSLGPGMPPD
jgi:hypothetical protein